MGDQMAIVTTSPRPRLVCGFTESVRTIVESLNDIQVTDAAGGPSETLAAAIQLVHPEDNARVICVTDARARISEDVVRELETGLEWIAVGESTDNIGITQFQVRRSRVSPSDCHLFIEVGCFCSDTQQSRLELRLNDSLIDVFPLTLEAGEVWTRTLDYTVPTGGVLTATLSDGGALEVDDTGMVRSAAAEQQFR